MLSGNSYTATLMTPGVSVPELTSHVNYYNNFNEHFFKIVGLNYYNKIHYVDINDNK